MADFDKAFEALILSEGGYVDDPNDSGGETYLGISRKYNSDWDGWAVIDEVKSEYGTSGITSRLKANDDLIASAKSLYKERYWDIFKLDDVQSQRIAGQIFDTCVNCGSTLAASIASQFVDTVLGKSVHYDDLKASLDYYYENNK